MKRIRAYHRAPLRRARRAARYAVDVARALTAREIPPSLMAATPPASRPGEEASRKTGGPSEEPIATRTMARILAAQGHRDRARAIYAQLMEHEPGDAALAAEAAALEEG